MKLDKQPVKTRMSRGKQRVVADRQQILTAAREIGIADGWKVVTIRALANRLGYTAPVLYEHFRNKEEVLTQLAVECLHELNRELRKDLSAGPEAAILVLVERYWSYMTDHPQLYRLMNGLDGVAVDGLVLGAAARGVCEATVHAIEQWRSAGEAELPDVERLADEVWALLHGMATLYLGRAVRFGTAQAQQAVSHLLLGASAGVERPAPVRFARSAAEATFVGEASDAATPDHHSMRARQQP